jgi:CheY-like chemotaxis protein
MFDKLACFFNFVLKIIMSPENARVFIFEDHSDARERLRMSLESRGHTVVGEAGNLNDALDAVDKFHEADVHVATLDGNLKQGDFSGQDAQTILKAIQEKAPDVITVGMSSLPINGVNKDVGKRYTFELGEEVTKL